MNVTEIVNNIFSVTPANFEALALQVFLYQYKYNPVYHQWVNNVHANPAGIDSLTDIPFLPVSFYKSHEVVSGSFVPEVIFESSGTTQTTNSRHLVKDVGLYKTTFTKGFQLFYGDVKDWCIIGLLPSYLERDHSSLVLMVHELITMSGHEQSGFYLYDYNRLKHVLLVLDKQQQKTLVIGVTFAMLDFAEQFPFTSSHITFMETGGMKGRREEMIRPQVHEVLQKGFGITEVHSEYGMTEMMSQAYSKGNGIFNGVPWMKVLVRDEDDPLHVKLQGRGVVNVIDLANVHSCSFIATDDAANVYADGSVEVLGRVDNSDIRGCSLMVM